MLQRWFRPNTYLVFGYALSTVLILLYVNMFPLWKHLSSRWGREVFVIVPIVLIVGGISMVIIMVCRHQRRAQLSVSKSVLTAGILLCTIALLIPDPELPVKRIHVAEYILLSLVVRFAMSFKLQGVPLLFFSACFASVLGIHDELLQGLHPARTYGLRDMAVNTLASIGGALFWHQLNFFPQEMPFSHKQVESSKNSSFVYIVWLITAILAFVLPLVLYRGSNIPYWPGMPLMGTIVYFSLYKDRFTASWKHGIGALSVASFALILYPITNNVRVLPFY